MQKLSRSLIALGGLAVLAACGDDVSITPPPDPVAVVTGVTVSPPTLTLSVGESATLGVSVSTTAPSVATTVTWTSSTPGVATVSATGQVTAVAVGNTTVRATSTADATKSGAAQVTVIPRAANLTAFSVTPTAAALGVGGTVQLVPNATTVGNPTVTYTYASSNTAVATVSASGLVTAVGNGTAVITTTATTNTNSISAATTITVASASVSISTITQGSLATPVNTANVAGQIEVTMNITAGNQSLDSVRVKLGNVPAATQVFTVNGAPSAPVTLSINTAAYTVNADSTASVTFLNGATGVQAELFVQGASGPTASNTINITLNNSDTFHARWALPTNSALSTAVPGPAGLIWYGGPGTSTTINVIPVMYTGNTVTSATIHMDDASVDGNASLCGAAVVDASSPFTGTFSCAGVTNATVQPGVAASLRADGNAGPAAVVVTDVNPVTPATLFANSAQLIAASMSPVRIDVQGPGTATFAWVAPTTNDYWANAGFRWDVSTAGKFSRTVGVDAGVGRDVNGDLYEFEDRAVAGTAWVSHAANTSDVPENPADFTVNAYNDRVSEKDMLGNITITYLGSTTVSPGTQVYGVDITEPSISYLTTALEPRIILPALDTLGTTRVLSNEGNVANTIRADSGYFGIRYRDTRSGFNTNPGQEPQFMQISRLAPAGPTCIVGGVNCAPARRLGLVDALDNTFRRDTVNIYGAGLDENGNDSRANPLYPTATNTDSTGYYHYMTWVVDRAGNSSDTITKTIAVDVEQPLITGIGFPAILTGGASVAFAPNATDDLEVLDGALGLTYPGMTAGAVGTDTLYFPNTFFADYKAPFCAGTNGVVNAIVPIGGAGCAADRLSNVIGSLAPFGGNGLTLPIGFLRGIDSVATADSLAPVANGPAYKPTVVVAQVFDIRSNPFTHNSVTYTTPPVSSAFFGAPILPGQVPAGLPITTLGPGGKWYIFGTGTTGGSIQARALTSTVITNVPFPQVAFFRLQAPGRWVYLGKVDAVPGSNPTIFDQGANRFWTYTLSGVTPSVATGDIIRAVGMTTAGDGLSTGSHIVP